jgi:hypothetical protein
MISLLAMASILLVGCVGDPMTRNAVTLANSDMAKRGSPYRWIATPVEGGTMLTKSTLGTVAATQADETLQADIRKNIAQLETQAGRTGDPQITEVRLWDKSQTTIREIWIVAVDDKSFAYVVSLTPDNAGGTTLHLTGPW